MSAPVASPAAVKAAETAKPLLSVRDLRKHFAIRGGIISRVVDKVEQELDKAQRAADSRKPAAERPTRVEVVRQAVSPWDRVGR